MLAIMPLPGRCQVGESRDSDSSLMIGVGAALLPSYRGSDDYRLVPVAGVRGRIGDIGFFSRGSGIYANLLPPGDSPGLALELGPVAALRLDRTRAIGDARVARLGQLKTAVELGGFVGVTRTGVLTSRYDTLSLRLAVVRDVAGVHSSTLITPTIDYATPLSKSTYVGVSLALEHVGAGLAQRYYGITPQQARDSGLPVFAARRGIRSLSLGVLGAKSLSGDLRQGLMLLAGIGYARLCGDFSRSPVVAVAGSRHQWLGGAGLGYRF